MDVFISCASEDADWARMLVGRLTDCGLTVFLDEWSLLPGDVVVHEVEAAIRESANGIAVISPASARSPRVLEEYAALVTAAAERGLRFIPVLLGDADPPPFAANRVWRDFRNVSAAEYDNKVGELAAVILGRAAGATGTRENLDAALSASPRPISEPDEHAVVVCYAAADAAYGGALVGQLRAAGLPAWSVGDLRPGDAHVWKIRQQLRYATAVVVLMSPQSQDSDDITRMILEGLLHGRPFFPILLHGERNYHLANTWYVDARDGRLLGADELDMLHQLYEEPGTASLPSGGMPPSPLQRPGVSAVRIPAATSLARLERCLKQGEHHYADLLTTEILLEAADRLDDGWMRERHARRLPPELLAGIDAVWSRHTHGRQGFRAQSALARVNSARHSEFLSLTVAYGWRASADDSIPRQYRTFADRAGPGIRAGFFPTLRNPQNERFRDWYDQWTATVLAAHLRLREWGSSCWD